MSSSVVHESAAVRAFRERVEARRGSAAYRNYEYARDRVLEMRAEAAASPGYRRIARRSHVTSFRESEI